MTRSSNSKPILPERICRIMSLWFCYGMQRNYNRPEKNNPKIKSCSKRYLKWNISWIRHYKLVGLPENPSAKNSYLRRLTHFHAFMKFGNKHTIVKLLNHNLNGCEPYIHHSWCCSSCYRDHSG